MQFPVLSEYIWYRIWFPLQRSCFACSNRSWVCFYERAIKIVTSIHQEYVDHDQTELELCSARLALNTEPGDWLELWEFAFQPSHSCYHAYLATYSTSSLVES